MSARIQELDWQQTAIGEISLRRRLDPVTKAEVFEVLLGEEYLMSSQFVVGEEELARLGLAALAGDGLDVIVGGLGLGYTARAVLADDRVRSLRVVDALAEVISWHERGLLPHAAEMTGDPRCSLVQGDFFALVESGLPFAPHAPERFHAIIVDIDHTPRHFLHETHSTFYSVEGLRRLVGRLRDGGVFALWSDAAPDDEFVTLLERVFATVESHVVTFDNHLTGGQSANTVYVASISSNSPSTG